ncbi:hypothetical protein AMTRI_Chr09g19110 [Amborella trichopoda]
MKILIWNVRGLGQSSKKSVVKDLTSKLCPTVLALLETKLPKPNLQLIRQVWGRRPSQWVSLPANGASGGIGVVWDPSDFTLNSSFIGEFSVTILLSSISDGVPWKFPAVYGPTSPTLRCILWSELGHVVSLAYPIWCLGGDFNVIRWDFSDFISRTELLDIPLQGYCFTWSNHATNPTLSKLDSLSLNWEEYFSRSSSLALPKPTSDHCPILLDTIVVQRGPMPFRFDLHWLQEKDFLTFLETWWNSPASQVSGRAGYILQTKLQILKTSLKTWSRSIPDNFSQLKSALLNTIQEIDHLEETRPLESSKIDLRSKSKLEYLSTLKKEEIYWFQRSRITWLKAGDHNTAFFHRIANCRRRDNSISMIKVNNRYLTQPIEIEQAILDFFQTLYSAPSYPRPRMTSLDFLTLTHEKAVWLEQQFTEEEILLAINALAKDKAPGPDGFPIAPFKESWDSFRSDFIKFFEEFFHRGTPPQSH